MRDMHDGMGGQLLSLLVQTRDPETPREDLEEAVEAAIVDLRLLVDSLDSVGDSLDVALAVFRDRVFPKMRAAGVQLGWHNELKTPTSGHSPSVTLNVYRILQEAMSNALRHADATKIGITIAPSDADGLILIQVADNGHGFTDSATMGRGLANMRRRAGEIGGKLVVESNTKGTRIGLLVPS
jgi:two-component system, NarL family, sensor histidine kinase UhpB